jgi:hypothetical protein
MAVPPAAVPLTTNAKAPPAADAAGGASRLPQMADYSAQTCFLSWE